MEVKNGHTASGLKESKTSAGKEPAIPLTVFMHPVHPVVGKIVIARMILIGMKQ